MHISIEDAELRKLEVDISRAPGRVQRNARQEIIKGARMVKREMKVDASGHRGNYFGHPGTSFITPLPKAVNYELLTELEAEIGFDKQGAGKLANIFAFGSVNNSPVFDHTAGLRRSTPAIERSFADAAEESVLGGDGHE